jgi:L-asparaginase
MKQLTIFCVGGTIDKVYFDAKSKYEVGAPAVGRILLDMNVGFEYRVVPLMAKDSLDMDDADRRIIAKAVSECQTREVVITHGTDTMVKTANALGSVGDKVVVLTGSLAPAIFRDSDAQFNVGVALGAVQSAKPGIYIAMNGCVFNANKVIKDVENNRFISQ